MRRRIPGDGWIQGMGWSYDAFGEAALPDKKYLDEVVSERPVFLSCFDGHTTWANSKALQLAGIDRNTPDPENGKIVRDAQGNPTGALKESASGLVRKVVPEPTREERMKALRAGLAEARSHGVTRIHSAGGDFEYFDLVRRVAEEWGAHCAVLRFVLSRSAGTDAGNQEQSGEGARNVSR